jgi:hypothetical protein
LNQNISIFIIYEDLTYDKFTLDLYNKLLINDEKEINIYIIDYIKLIKNHGNKQKVNWKLLNDHFEEDELGKFCYLQIDGNNINLNNNFYNFQIIIKYYYEDKMDEINYVNCRGFKCRRIFPKCRERYCEGCFGNISEMFIDDYKTIDRNFVTPENLIQLDIMDLLIEYGMD